jgi:iron complex transport system substrate-binding protein
VRIVSFVPAATEIACALGAADELVAVTHDCDHPPRVRGLPRITRSTIAPGSGSAQIDAQVRRAAAQGESTFHLDLAALQAARADVVLGQTLCAVCAVTLDQLPAMDGGGPTVVPLHGESIEGILSDIGRVADALGRSAAGTLLVAGLRSRLDHVARSVAGLPRRSVVCLEWLAPLFNGGHWVPEQVAWAGGVDLLGTAGARSRELGWPELVAAQPEVVLVMPCGFDAGRAVREAGALTGRAEWRALRAVTAGRAYALDGNAYFSRPGPRVIDGVELLASLLHPGSVPAPPGATVRPLATLNGGS